MKKFSVILLVVYLLVLVLFALQSSISDFKNLVNELGNNPPGVSVANFIQLNFG